MLIVALDVRASTPVPLLVLKLVETVEVEPLAVESKVEWTRVERSGAEEKVQVFKWRFEARRC